MSDYNLQGLSTRSFEHLVQALSVKFLGHGVTIFGDGPDGGREATFRGELPFPSESDKWNGYGIVQAKFRQRPSDDHANNLKWLRKELTKELNKFKKKKALRPDFYVLVTNVVLTAGSGGGKDQINDLFGSRQRSLGLRDWRVWDYDQICTFLDNAADIRISYSAWITSGDVLSATLNALLAPERATYLANALFTFIAKELHNEQYANLEQAGHNSEDKIPLARVFVDLPVAPSGSEIAVSRQLQAGDERYFLSHIIEAARDKLDTRSLDLGSKSSAGPAIGRYVLIGGPGQGKTTLGQFACQVFRASVLRDRPRGAALAPEVRQALKGILEQCESQGIEIPSTKRFPIRIILSEFADAIQQQGDTFSLLGYLSKRITSKSGFNVDDADLREWIAKYPWLLVLDGLDEVPASSNRDQVLRAIGDFWSDVATLNGDILVVATTRPQGYSEEFAPAFYEHLSLRPLQRDSAQKYAARLVAERYGNEPERAQKILSRLRQANALSSTAKLMTSPLQVTIMATLVDQIGQPPQDRWRLFHDYYEVIFRREMERDIPAARLLRERRKDIDTIHNWVALLLQVEAERSGSAEAKLDAQRFRAIVAARLKDEGYDGTLHRQLVEEMVEAAANRLVFIVGLQEGQVGFEIRSLQEFMAAEALMQGADVAVQARLDRIAPITSWRNVFLFAAGRCFAEAQHLRDTVIRICVQMNGGGSDSVLRIGRAGSRLAAELLIDGVANRQPKYGALLLSCAMEALDAKAIPEYVVALAVAYSPTLDQAFRTKVEEALQQRSFEDSVPVWTLVGHLGTGGVQWALDMARQYLSPTELVQFSKLFGHRGSRFVIDAVAPQALYRLSPREVRVMASDAVMWGRSRERVQLPELAFGVNKDCAILVSDLAIDSALVRITPIKGRRHHAVALEPLPEHAHLSWHVMREMHEASEHLSARSLAAAFRRLAAIGVSVSVEDLSDVQWMWPLQALLSTAAGVGSLEFLADSLEAGRYGDISDWIAAEERFRGSGLTPQDVAQMTDDRWPIDGHLAKNGAPVAAFSWPSGQGRHPYPLLLSLLDAAPSGSQCQRFIAREIQAALYWGNEPPSPALAPTRLLHALELSGKKRVDAVVLEQMCDEGVAVDEMCHVVREVGESLWIGQRPYKAFSGFLAENRTALHPVGDRVISRLIADSDSSIHRTVKPALSKDAICLFVDAQVAVLNGLTTDQVQENLIEAANHSETRDTLIQMLSRREVDDATAEVLIGHVHRLINPTDVARRNTLGLAVSQLIDRRRTNLEQAHVWTALELPIDVLNVLRRDGASTAGA